MAASGVVYQYRSLVMGAIMSSTAFLEAKLAELVVDAAGRPFWGSSMGLTPDQCGRVSDLMGVRGSLLDRYQKVLQALGSVPMEPDVEPFRSVALAVRLRNFIVHYSGDWAPVADDESGPIPEDELHIMERRLKGVFASTAFADPSAPFFPDHCLSAACASWAAEAALAFSDELSRRAGILQKHLRPIIRDE
jgi:hypothetical protein